jgi:hypothetical protein
MVALQSRREQMEQYVGLDVSLKMTAICIVDRTGKIVREGMVASDPDEVATFVTLHAPHVVRIGLETGATSTWLWTELSRRGLPIICIDARHAKAALNMQINKSHHHAPRRAPALEKSIKIYQALADLAVWRGRAASGVFALAGC